MLSSIKANNELTQSEQLIRKASTRPEHNCFQTVLISLFEPASHLCSGGKIQQFQLRSAASFPS